MSIDKIRSELFRLLSSEKESVYSTNDQDEKMMHNASYNIYNEYYMVLRKDSSFSFVFDLKSKVLEKVTNLEKTYNQLLDKYNKEKNNEEKKKLVSQINSLVVKIDCLNRVYNIISRNLKTNNNDYTDQSNKIIKTMEKFNKTKSESSEEELYRLMDERRVRLSSKSSSYIIKDICELESIEQRIASTKDNPSSYKLTRKEALNALKDTIQAINEYYFLDFKKSKHYKENPDISKEENDILFQRRLNLYINKYYSLISSIFNDNYYMISKGNNRISSDDLINYISLYNLDGNYEIFRSKFKNRLIGTKDVNRVDYQEKVDFLNNMINILISDAANKIKTKEIEIVDKANSQDDLIKKRDRKLSEIDSIIEGEVIHARR